MGEEEEERSRRKNTLIIESSGQDTQTGNPIHVTRKRERLQSNDEYNYFISKGEHLYLKRPQR